MNRILIIGYIPNINGMSTSVMNVYRNLDRKRFQYDFLLRSSCLDYGLTPDMEEILSLGGNLYYMDYEKYSFPESSCDKLQELMLSIPDLKGVHVHDLSMMSSPLYLADKMGFPVKVIQSHASWGDHVTGVEKILSGIESRRQLISGSQFDRLACSDLAGSFDFGDLPYDIIPNGVEIDRFTFNPVFRSILRRKLGIAENACVIGTVANLFPPKNPIFSLKVFHRFHEMEPNSHYFILGKGTMKKDILKYIQQNHLAGFVHVFGSKQDIDIYYDAIDAILHPSISEGLPNSLIEAQTKGLTCLISDAITDMVKITPLIHFFPLSKDEYAWADQLRLITGSRAPRRSWKEEIKSAGYDARDVAKKVTAMYSRRIHGQNDP